MTDKIHFEPFNVTT